MNLKFLTLSSAASAILMAASPMVSSSMSTDNGGSKKAIDAYSDGGGVLIINQAGDTKFDNSAMNKLVFKYGDAAKSSNTTLKNQINILSATATANEKLDAASKLELAKVVINPPVNGTDCDDGNNNTSGDKWLGGVCTGSFNDGVTCDDTNPLTFADKYTNNVCAGVTDGTTCSDNNNLTFLDKYTAGVCAGIANGTVCDDTFAYTYSDKYTSGVCGGTTAASCKDIKALTSITASGAYTIKPTGLSEILAYCDMATDGGGWTMNVRLNTGDAVTRRFDNAIWTTPTGTGSLADSLDYASPFINAGVPAKEIMLEFNYSDGKIVAAYSNAAITNNMFFFLNQSVSNNNINWSKVFTNNSIADNFFGPLLSFSVLGNGDDAFRIWYNKTSKDVCNQTGGIGTKGDAYSWWIEAGFTSDHAVCQENYYRSYLGSNRGGTHSVITGTVEEALLSPSAIYSTNIIRIYSR